MYQDFQAFDTDPLILSKVATLTSIDQNDFEETWYSVKKHFSMSDSFAVRVSSLNSDSSSPTHSLCVFEQVT